MYQEKKLERRRRDYLRMKERARRIQARWWSVAVIDPILDDKCGKLANNLKICSCSLCGNPRTLSLQEQKSLDDAVEQLKGQREW